MVNEIGFTHGPRSRISEESRQAALDAAARLQIARSDIAAELMRGEDCQAHVVARTGPGILLWIRREVRTWRELLSVRPSGTLDHVRTSLPTNRQLVADGLQMVSLWDWDGLKPEARRLLAGERIGRYLFGVGPVQMNLVGRRWVLLQGPTVEGESTVMAVTDRACVAAAWRYWHAAVASSYPADEDEAVELEALTPRQRQVAALLAVDTRDETIAETLEVSVRTVRSDVARLMETLGVRSRFAAGVRFRDFVEDPFLSDMPSSHEHRSD